MSAWAPKPWQKERWSQVQGAIAAGRLAHSLLLAGPRHSGKKHFALGLASFLLCEGPGARPCGVCPACASLRAGVHPNAWLLELTGVYGLASSETLRNPDGATFWQPPSVRADSDKVPREIAVDGVRELIDRLHLSSGRAKVAVIAPADALNNNAANALLKIVEEPPPNTHVVFVAEYWRTLPATLRSRCQLLRFPAPPADAVKPDPAFVEARKEWSGALAEIFAGGLPLQAAAGVKRDDANAALEHWLAAGTIWLRRLLAGGGTVPKGATAASLQALLDDCMEALRALERNGNPTLLLESIMIRLSQRAGSGR